MSIANECMILNLHVSFWAGQRLDKAATQDLTRRAGADADAARVNKHLINKAALANVSKAMYAVRTHFYTGTLPWKDNGDRIISRKAYMRFIQRHEELVGEFNATVLDFCKNLYPVEVQRAEFRMGTLFDRDDYPAPREVARRFHMSLDIDPVSQASDFRVGLSDSEVERIKGNIEQATVERMRKAMMTVWERLADVLGSFVERTKSGSGIRIELTRNVQEIVELLPELNIANDPQLEEIRQLMETKLVGYEAADLRKDDTVRAQAAKDADEIMDRMRGFMTAFGGSDAT